MKTDEEYMTVALNEAALAYNAGEIPVGAVVVDENGNIIATGHNEKEQTNNATAHAEIIAIQSAGQKLNNWRLSGCTLYVTLEPCPMCAGAIVMARLARVVYGLPDAKTGALESLFNIPGHPSLNHYVEVTAGIKEDECRKLLKNFFKAKRE